MNFRFKHDAIKVMVKDLLTNPHAHVWSLQGFGMLRTHLCGDTNYRLNVWDSRYRVPNVSLVHNHPWHFDSLIVVGCLTNIRYLANENGQPFKCLDITPGPVGGRLSQVKTEILQQQDQETYSAGDVYHQQSYEIHKSLPEDGTVTLNKRERIGDDRATVWWNDTPDWVDAKPREATPDEIDHITKLSLERWF